MPGSQVPGLSCQQGITSDVGQDVPQDGLNGGQVVGANEPEDLPEGLVVVDFGVVPADTVDPVDKVLW